MMKTALCLWLLCAASASSEPLVDQHRITKAGNRLTISSHPLFFLGRNSRDILQGFRAVDEDDYSDEEPENFEEADDEGDTIYEDDDGDDNVSNDGDNNDDDEDDREGDDGEDDNKEIGNFRLQPTPLISRDHVMGSKDDAVVEFMVKSVTNTKRGGTAALLVPLVETESPRAKQLIVRRLPKGSQPNVIRLHIGGTDRGQNNRRRRVNKPRNIRVYVINGKDRRVSGNNRIKVIRL